MDKRNLTLNCHLSHANIKSKLTIGGNQLTEGKKIFEIQVNNNFVRQPVLSAKAFVMWVKLTHLYQGIGQKEELQLIHKKLMEYTRIAENRTFKEIMTELHTNGLIKNKIETLPRKTPITIYLNTDIIPSAHNKLIYTQMTEHVVNKKIIEEIGHVGVRLLYYYKSRINYKSLSTSHCFASEETIGAEIGVNRKTIIKYNKILEKLKFIKINKHQLERRYYENGNSEIYGFYKYNNHVYVNIDKINDFVRDNYDKIAL